MSIRHTASKNKIKLKKGDLVKVITGSCKGQTGKIKTIFPKENLAIVENINLKKRHAKPSARSEGGIISQEGAINISNLIFCDSEGNVSGLGYKILEGKKVRFMKKIDKIV